MIFRLDLNQGIYVHFLRRREIIPLLNTGFYHIEDFEKTYQRTATRKNLNSPPGQSTLVGLKRPTLTTTKKGQVAWKKSLVVVDMLPASGEIREKFQGNMLLTEETSSVDEVQRVLKEKLKFELILLDANTSSTDEVSSVSDTVHLELFSDCFRQMVSRPLYQRFLPRH